MKRIFAIALALVLFAGGLARDKFDAWVAATVVPPLTTETSVEVLDRNNQLLRAYTVADGRWRLAVTGAQVDPRFVKMLVAYEDKRFFSHGGVDLRAMMRAAGQAIWYGDVVSGASTLTMQVARLLEDGSTGQLGGKLRQLGGKLRQMRLALALERRLTKDQILELYLNRAPYGGNLEGVRAASRAYFGKDPRRLTAAQAALLVALPQSPEARRPDRDPVTARAARDRVLDRVGGDALPLDEAISAQAEPVSDRRRAFPKIAPHMADRARQQEPLVARHHLTLDMEKQKAFEDLAAQAVREKGRSLSVALLAMDHVTGEVVASVGSAGYRGGAGQGFVDMTQAVRSPGSTLKPLVYGLAFDEGLVHPETLIDDKPRVFGGYAPQNFDGLFRGTLRVREALQLSLNIPVVALTEALGPARLMAHLERAGMSPRLPGGEPGLAVALGGVGVSLEDLVRLYGALGQGGAPVPLHWRAGGDVEEASNRVLSDVAAWHVGDILRGIAPPANASRNGLAYKTGTSYGHRDAWAVGFDGRHVVGVWIGRPDGTPVPGVFGGDLAAPVLFEAFGRLKTELEPLSPPPAATLMVETAALPAPLQRFRPRGAIFAQAIDAPRIAFPPDGARLEGGGAIFARVRDGIAPFTWLADGRPVAVGAQGRDVRISDLGAGFVTLSVIDAKGRASRAAVFLEPVETR